MNDVENIVSLILGTNRELTEIETTRKVSVPGEISDENLVATV